jgi:hypothetical protein
MPLTPTATQLVARPSRQDAPSTIVVGSTARSRRHHIAPRARW